MNASRILPTVAFTVAVSFFFVPPVIAVVKSQPAAAKPVAPQASLIVATTPVATTPVALSPLRNRAAAESVCAPSGTTTSSTETDSKSPKRSPWNPWVVASLETH